MSNKELDERTAALLDTLSLMNIENERMRAALNEIREIANVSDGSVQFYAMLAERGLKHG